MKKHLIITFFIINSLILTACQEKVIETENIDYSVSVIKVQNELMEDIISLPAKVEYKDSINLSFLVGGEISKIHVNEGDIVSKGDVIAQLTPKGLELNVQSALSDYNSSFEQYQQSLEQFEYLEIQYENAKKLYEIGSISKNEFDQIKLNYEISQNMVSIANSQMVKAKEYLDYTRNTDADYIIMADKDYLISSFYYEEGEIVSAGMPIVSVSELGNYILVNVNYQNLKYFKINETVRVIYNDGIYEGTIVKMDSNPDQITLEYKINISVDEELPIGEIVKIQKTVESLKGIVLPINSIMGQEGNYYVYVVEENKVVRKDVEIIKVINNKILINGIIEDELVIFEGNKLVREGFQVIINEIVE